MRAAGDAGPYGSESGAVSKFENISKRTDISTSRAGATRGGITNNIKNHEASQKPPLRSNGAAHYRAERGSGSGKRIVSDSLYDDVQHLGFRGVRGDRFLTYPNRAGSLETCGFKQRFWSLLGLRPKVTRARKRGVLPSKKMSGPSRTTPIPAKSISPSKKGSPRPWARDPCNHQSLSSLRTAINASVGTCTVPRFRIFFLPSFCFSSSFFLRVISPP